MPPHRARVPRRRRPTLAIRERMLEEGTTITRLIDKREAAGLLRREPDCPDRRQVMCYTTEAGAALLDQIDPTVDAGDAVCIEALSEEGRWNSCASWTKCTSNAARRAARRSRRPRAASLPAQHALGWLGGYGFSGTLGWMASMLGFPAPLAALAILTELVPRWHSCSDSAPARGARIDRAHGRRDQHPCRERALHELVRHAARRLRRLRVPPPWPRWWRSTAVKRPRSTDAQRAGSRRQRTAAL
jgi:hypothetical protein